MDECNKYRWDRMPSIWKQKILFKIDEIIENNMMEYEEGRGAGFPTVMREAIGARIPEALFRYVMQMMVEEELIFCSFRLIHRFSDVQELWPKYSLG